MVLAALPNLTFLLCVSSRRGEEDDSLAIKPPQQMSRKEKAHHKKDEKRKEKRRHRSHSAEGTVCLIWGPFLALPLLVMKHPVRSQPKGHNYKVGKK